MRRKKYIFMIALLFIVVTLVAIVLLFWSPAYKEDWDNIDSPHLPIAEHEDTDIEWGDNIDIESTGEIIVWNVPIKSITFPEECEYIKPGEEFELEGFWTLEKIRECLDRAGVAEGCR